MRERLFFYNCLPFHSMSFDAFASTPVKRLIAEMVMSLNELAFLMTHYFGLVKSTIWL